MGRFNFTNINLNSKANITEVMDNFNKIDTSGITEAEVTSAISAATTNINNAVDTKLTEYTKTDNLGGLALKPYSIGKAAPSGGSNGDIYDQYFD